MESRSAAMGRSVSYHGIYINLERSTARRRNLERQLRRLGLADRYTRLNAVDGRTLAGVPPDRAGVVGCFVSQVKAIDQAKRTGGLVHIIEDDVILTDHVAPFIQWASAQGLFDRFDIVFLDMWVDPLIPVIEKYRNDAGEGLADPADFAKYSVVDLKGMRIGAAASYVVPPKSIDNVLFHLKAELTRGPRMAFDACLGTLVEKGALKAAVIVPFLTGIDLDEGAVSMIQKLDEQEHRLFLLLRSAFFVGRDLDGVILLKMAEIGAKKAYPRLDEIREILAGTAVPRPD